MADEVTDYRAFLALMEAQRAKLDATITALKDYLSLGGTEEGSVAGGPNQPTSEKRSELPTKIEFDTFFSLSIPEAIRKYLAMMKRPQTVSAITDALRAGGLSTTAEDLMGTITATLTRMRRTSEDVVPVRRGEWGLKEWYPGRRFDKPEQPKKSSKKRGGKGKNAKAKGVKKKTQVNPTDTTKAPVQPEQGPPLVWKPTPDQIEQIKALHAAGKKPGEISKETGVATLAVGRVIAAANKTKPAEKEATA